MSLRVSNVTFSEFPKLNNGNTGTQNTLPVPANNTQPIMPHPTPPIIIGETKQNFLKENLSLINSGLALVSLGVAGVAIARGKGSKIIEEAGTKINELGGKLENLGTKLNDMTQNVTNMGQKNQTIEQQISSLAANIQETANKAEKNSELLKQDGWFDKYVKDLDRKIKDIQAAKTYSATHQLERNVGFIDGMPLLRNVDNAGNTIKVDTELEEWMHTAASRYINNGEDHININKLDKDSSVWSLTFESKPEKEGGLGEVPVQIAKNMKETFGIDNPLIRPMSLIPGKSQLIEENGKYIYRYNINDPKPWKMGVEKVAEFETQVTRNGRVESQPVQVFVGEDPAYHFPRIMFANNDYFTAGGLYKNSQKVNETERCAFFTKIAYEFAKYLKDPNSIPNMKINNSEILSTIKAPKAMILNDWHAAAMAALLRFKAPMEGKAGELSKKAAEELKSMNLININHNLDYQGMDFDHKADVLNTLFDRFTYDIYENALTGFGHNELKNVFMTGDSVNLANIGASLSNILKPVSPTYAKEVGEQARRSHYMQHILDVRRKQGTLRGASNGWDRDFNDVSSANIQAFNNSINSDKFEILKHSISNIKGLTTEQYKKISQLFEEKLNFKGFEILLDELRNMESGSINHELNSLKAKGHLDLRRFNSYTYASSDEDIMLARKRNKQLFIEYLNNMNEYNKNVKGIFNIVDSNLTDLSHITPEELEQTIVYNMGVRFVSQKGVDVACQSIKRVLTEWETKFPGKKKPIFVIGGADAEGGNIKKIAYDLKKELGPDLGKHLVYQDGYTKNNIFQAGSDFTLYSSHFEPDGAKWESLYKGTPVICTRVGGHVDSVVTDAATRNGFLTKRTIPEIDKVTSDEHGNRIAERYLTEMSNDFTDAIYESASVYYQGKPYTDMVMNAIRGNQSWLIKDHNGNVTGGALLGHMKDLGFDFKDFPKIIAE